MSSEAAEGKGRTTSLLEEVPKTPVFERKQEASMPAYDVAVRRTCSHASFSYLTKKKIIFTIIDTFTYTAVLTTVNNCRAKSDAVVNFLMF